MNGKTKTVLFSITTVAITTGLILKYLLEKKRWEESYSLLLEELTKPVSANEEVAETPAVPTIEEPAIEPAITTTSEPPAETIIEVATLEENDDFPLRLGSKGPRVMKLNAWLMRNYGWDGTISDLLDEKALAKMKKYLRTETLEQALYQQLRLDAPLHKQKIIR